ncbi:heparin lyase I family protein [Pseudooctadecabacter jejudonensis]|uniref:Polysaccharide lyase n=1 Tax=Pseudooctadecabacter jejudonensis TaxID=1391910 RepID=A0A1Y5S3H1_9RHOB|nr:heparin lyase I family protein [Pseudooctadecabacter jejudonensis]SLN28910.1 hypothetical protein PSJ8397_01233 [Pseudooctadecabacter jejudonensis]
MKVFFTLLVFALAAPMAQAQPSLADGFGRFNLEAARNRYAVQHGQLSDGTQVERFELRDGDCTGTDCSRDRERVEFIQNTGPRNGTEVWVGYSVMLDPTWPDLGPRMNTKIGQWHLPRFQGRGQGPTLLMEVNDECLIVSVKDPNVPDTDPMNPAPNLAWDCIAPRSQLIGRFNRIMVNAIWSTGADGKLDVYLNGRLAWSHRGRTINVNAQPYFRYGIYRSFVSRCAAGCGTQIAYFSDVVQGRSRAEVE